MQTCDEQMLKISRQYLDLRKSYDQLTENLAQQMAYLDPFKLPHERNFLYLERNGVLKFFERVFRPDKFSGS